MIFDVTGIVLTPGKRGRDCLGNGRHRGRDGLEIPCCCDECDYMLCCLASWSAAMCRDCTDSDCPRRQEPPAAEGG